MNYLLDTCVLSEGRRPHPDERVMDWLKTTDPLRLYISVLTIGELEKGAQRAPTAQKKEDLLRWIHHDIEPHFEDRILAIDRALAVKWGQLVALVEERGKPLPAIDSLIGAAALIHRLTVVTRNTSHFQAADIPVFNPWLT